MCLHASRHVFAPDVVELKRVDEPSLFVLVESPTQWVWQLNSLFEEEAAVEAFCSFASTLDFDCVFHSVDVDDCLLALF